jgi:hypothetical protein
VSTCDDLNLSQSLFSSERFYDFFCRSTNYYQGSYGALKSPLIQCEPWKALELGVRPEKTLTMYFKAPKSPWNSKIVEKKFYVKFVHWSLLRILVMNRCKWLKKILNALHYSKIISVWVYVVQNCRPTIRKYLLVYFLSPWKALEIHVKKSLKVESP